MPFRSSRRSSSSKRGHDAGRSPPPGSFPTSEMRDGNNTSWTHSESSFEGERHAPLLSLESPPRQRGDDVSSIHLGESVSNGITPKLRQNQRIERLSSNYRNASASRHSSASEELDILLDTISLAERDADARKERKEKNKKGKWKNNGKTEPKHPQENSKKAEATRSHGIDNAILPCEFQSHDAIDESENLIQSVSNPRMSPAAALVGSAVSLSLLTASDSAPDYAPNEVVRESFVRHIHVCLLNQSDTTKSCENTEWSLPVDVDEMSLVNRDQKTVQDVALVHITEGEPEKAVEIFRVLLQNQRLERGNCDYNAEELEAIIAQTKSILTTLSLITDNTQDAWKYATSALQTHKKAARHVHATLSTMELGHVYFAAGKLTQALQCWRESLQLACMTLGYDNIQVATLLGNLGCLHYYLGNYSASSKALEESLGLQRQALRSNSQCAHVEMPLFQMATTMGNLAMVFATCKNYDAASSLMEEALAIQESVLSGDEKVTGISEKHLSSYTKLRDAAESDVNSITQNQGENTSSHESASAVGVLMQQALLIFGDTDGIPRRYDGSKHHHMSPSRYGVSSCDDDPFHDCILLGSLVKPATARQRVHAALVQSLENASRRQPNVTRYSDDETVTSTMGPRKKQPIPVDLDGEAVIDAEFHLEEINLQAVDHLARKEFKDALDLFESALKSHKHKYGDIHHLVGTGLHNCGIVHLLAEQYVHGKMCFQEAVSVRSAALGEGHPDVAASKFKIGMIHMAGGDSESALATFMDVISQLQMNMSTYGFAPEGRMLNNIGVVLYELGRNHEAFQSFWKAYQIQKGLMSDPNSCPSIEMSLANTLSNLGFIYAKQDQYSDSLEAFNEALDILRKNCSTDHALIVTVEENLAHVKAYGATEKEEPAEQHVQSEVFASCSRLGEKERSYGQSRISACFRLQ